ncbi:hypothetical protein RND71_010865 [Anisodus tanguticus]|uniref:Uncharacterized protein n=1 Tax=Anisodus tanguticus TaxID=243964 RepID=A0AAE1SKK8_9SOLA|nr:hypothetical protein RND71_010865 [Anisodus tanguticus]
MAGLQYYFFPTDFYYPRPPKINVDNKISTDDVATMVAVRGGVLEKTASGPTLDRRDMLLQDKILKIAIGLEKRKKILLMVRPYLVRIIKKEKDH